MNTGTPEYLQKTVTSTRIRLARNVRGYYFPHLLSDENAREIVGLVRRALKKLDNFREYDIGRISRDDAELLVEKHSLTADFKLADDNGFVQYKGQFYASLDKLSKLLDMPCSFDTATNTLTMTDKSEGVSTVPTKYDLRERQRVSLIRDQGSYGT